MDTLQQYENQKPIFILVDKQQFYYCNILLKVDKTTFL